MNIRKHIPNSITSMNLLCGVVGVILALQGQIRLAFMLMLLAAFFDFFDGLAARLLNAYSPVGKELDSLADDVSFGVMPAIMLFVVYNPDFRVLGYIPILIAVFSALRLAKFNIDDRQADSFIGLPTPACAMACGSLACVLEGQPLSKFASACQGPVLIPLLSLFLCWLMVSEIPMFSMKMATGHKSLRIVKVERIIFFAVVAASLAAVLVFRLDWTVIILASFLGYIAINLSGVLFIHPERKRA